MGDHHSNHIQYVTIVTLIIICQVIARRHDNLCLPSAEDTDVTELYQHHMSKPFDHMIKPLDPVLKDKPLASHDPLTSHNLLESHDPMDSLRDSRMLHNPLTQASHDPMPQTSHDTLAEMSHDSIKETSCDMDTLMASLSVFDATHFGRLGTAVSTETSSTIM